MTHHQNEPQHLLERINIFLKQMVLALFPRANTAALTGTAWLKFLDETGKTQGFTQGAGKILLTGPYEKFPKADVLALKRLITQWIEINV